LQVWQSSAAKDLVPIIGAFRIDVSPTLMVKQTLQFLFERSRSASFSETMTPFLMGSQYWTEEISALYYVKAFANSEELFAYDTRDLYDLVLELELHTDVNFTITQLTYLADIGSGGPSYPLLIAERQPIARGIGFEIEQRGIAAQSLANPTIRWTSKAKTAHQYYSTGLTLLALEDQVSGLFDAAFMQFHLAIEVLLKAYKVGQALEHGKLEYQARFTPSIEAAVVRVFEARNNYFGHANSSSLSEKDAFALAKQTLVARWCARSLLELEVGTELVHREMRLYGGDTHSFAFEGDTTQLNTDFALPKKVK
jgi:hypothetical protein